MNKASNGVCIWRTCLRKRPSTRFFCSTSLTLPRIRWNRSASVPDSQTPFIDASDNSGFVTVFRMPATLIQKLESQDCKSS